MKDLILLHGAIGASEQLEPLKNRLKNSFRVWSFDFPGHGKSSSAQDFRIPDFAAELENFIDQHQLKKPLVFGYSMGGYVALYLEAKKPNSLGGLLTLGTKLDWTPETAAGEVKKLNPDLIEMKVPHFAELLRMRHGDNWADNLLRTQEMMLDLGRTPALTTAILDKVKVNCRLMVGANDTMVSVEETDSFAKAMENGSFKILEKVEHPIEKVPLSILEQEITSYFG